MSLAYWCILVAAILPYGTVGVAKALGAYDNRDPRKAGMYDGVAYRAHGAHLNGLETFAFFAVAVLVASGSAPHAEIPLLNGLAAVWIVLRLVYIATYLFDLPTARSVVWIGSYVLTVAIFTMPAWHG